MFGRLEFLISKRIGDRSKIASHHRGGVMVTIATTAVALSIAVMVITLSIVMGFRSEVYDRFTALSGDLMVAPVSGVNPSATESITESEELVDLLYSVSMQEGVTLRSATPYAYRSAVVRTPEGVEGVIIKGVDSYYDLTPMQRGLQSGEIPHFGGEQRGRSVIVSSELADQLSLEVGDRLELLVVDGSEHIKRDLYRVGAIYSGGMGEVERALIIADIAHVQRLNGWSSDQLSGYDIKIDWDKTNRGSTPLEELSTALNSAILYHEGDGKQLGASAVFSTHNLYPSIFEWLSALDVNAIVVITIMIIVAIFNIITVMLILVLEHSEMIGVLKCLGMNNRSLSRIFILRSLWITVRGLVAGNVVALILLLLQQHFEIISLDESSYILSSVPTDLSLDWLFLLNGGVVIVILAAIAIPTRIVGKIEPSRAIKFQ